jgi:hypothetical protein
MKECISFFFLKETNQIQLYGKSWSKLLSTLKEIVYNSIPLQSLQEKQTHDQKLSIEISILVFNCNNR